MEYPNRTPEELRKSLLASELRAIKALAHLPIHPNPMMKTYLDEATVLDPEADRQAYVHWPVGTEFESAKPRPATADEIRKYTNMTLQQLNA